MQPAARLSAAIEILDTYLSGHSAEKALTNWARRSRFAGSKDRAAIRDIVFDCLRKRKSYAACAGSETGRGLVYAYAQTGRELSEVEALFSGDGHAPAPLTASERGRFGATDVQSWEARHNMPLWLKPDLEASLGQELEPVCTAMADRAPVFLRVNLRKASVVDVQEELSSLGVLSQPHSLASSVLEVIENPRKVASSAAYLEGRVELQDAASQAICEGLPKSQRMLDFCAGGGGKVLAYGARQDALLFAHDANIARLRDLPVRAMRGGINVNILSEQECKETAPFDLVLCDVPCSGSGSWRRAPEGKWSLDDAKLADLLDTQQQIMKTAASLLSPAGTLVYVTCSILMRENNNQIQEFIKRSSDLSVHHQRQFLPQDGGDGFYVAHLTRHGDTP